MQRILSLLITLCLAALTATPVRAAQPADPDLIPEARKVLDYLASQYGKNVISGMSSYGGWKPVYEVTGHIPAIYGNDASGWNRPKNGASYNNVVRGAIQSTRDWWHVKGGIPSMQWHWMKPGNPNGSAWVEEGKGTGPMDMKKLVTPGTEEYQAAMDDMKHTADFLEELAKERVPVLWRPLHEIDGGWFWWTDKAEPENTAELWRMMYRYFVKERKLHNLIWVYSAGVHAGGLKKGATLEEEIAFRKRYYPGPEYVDISGIDIYPDNHYKAPELDSYAKAYALMQQVSPGKILALTESAAIPNPQLMKAQGPGWLYALPWFTFGANSADWMRTTYQAGNVITLDELPQLVPHNVEPNVRLEAPADGARLDGGEIKLKAVAFDRDKNLKSVEFIAIPGPWKNWFMRDGDAMKKEMGEVTRLGEARPAEDGAYTLAWKAPLAGMYSVMAIARDAEGLETISNAARVRVGLTNLAQDCVTTASSDEKNAAQAVDGDLFTSWSGKKEGEQWLAVDLGQTREIASASVTWWKAYARSFQIQVSEDGKAWQDVSRVDNKREFSGDTDLLSFAPVRGRHVRLLCTQPGTNWGGYTVYDFAVYAPEKK